MMKKTVATFGRLDILFNNAGIAEETPKLMHEYTTEEWNRILAVDLQGVFFCARDMLCGFSPESKLPVQWQT